MSPRAAARLEALGFGPVYDYVDGRRVAEFGWDTCLVLDDRGIVLGRLGRRALAADADISVDEAMSEGPSTVRPSARLAGLVERMQRQSLSNLPVTTQDGRLVGLLLRTDAERAFAGSAGG